MPGYDGTGPRGMGPITGGGRGFCNPVGIRDGWRPYGARRWAGYGGYGYPFGASLTREQERDCLKNEAQALRATLNEIDARVKELTEQGK